MVGHGGSSAGSYLADPTSPIPSHCASIVVTSTVRVKGLDSLCHMFALLDPFSLEINSYSASHDNWCTGTPLNRIMTAQWEGMGDVGSARYKPAPLPPCPTIRVLSYSN